MAGVGKATIRPAINQTLTATYERAMNNTPDTQISEESLASIEIVYTTGATEVASKLQLIIWYSWDAVTWVPQTVSNISSGVETLDVLSQEVVGGAGNTQYARHYMMPLCSRHLKIMVKESGVITNFGNISIAITQAAGSGQSRNTQVVSVAAPAITNVNLTQVGNSAVTLGAKTTAQSIPVTLPTDLAPLVTILKDLGIVIRTYLSQTAQPVYVDENNVVRMPIVNSAQSGTWNITNLSQLGGVDASATVGNINSMSTDLQLRNLIS